MQEFSCLLRTNLLSDFAMLSPNIGAEVIYRKKMSLVFDYSVGFYLPDADFHYHSFHSLMAEIRYYLSSSKSDVTKGHHLGAYAQLGTYDFMYEGKGFQCKPYTDTYAIGLCYGYTHPINRQFKIDFAFGLGCLHTKYAEYKRYNDMYIHTDTKSFTKVLPTRAEITLVWVIK